jgi:L-rhamnose mutarotase
MTRRFGFALTLRAADVDEYRRRHDAIWPEVTAELKSQEITSFSLFVDPRMTGCSATSRRKAPTARTPGATRALPGGNSCQT